MTYPNEFLTTKRISGIPIGQISPQRITHLLALASHEDYKIEAGHRYKVKHNGIHPYINVGGFLKEQIYLGTLRDDVLCDLEVINLD